MERIFEFGGKIGDRDVVDYFSPSKRRRLQTGSPTTATPRSRTHAHTLCPPPAPWRCAPRRPPAPLTPQSIKGTAPWPPSPLLAVMTGTGGRMARMDSRGTGQVTRGDRWWTLTPSSSSGSSPSLLLNKADKPQFSATEPAPSILVGGREEIHLPPEKCPALWLFRNHHHPPVLLPLLPSSQREQCSKREKNISKTESSTNTTTTATRGSSSSSSRRSRKEEDQDQEEEEDYYSGRSSLSSSTSTATKKKTYLRWAGQDVRPVTPPAVGADPGGSSSSHSSSIHTSSSSSSSTPGWSTMGVQGGTDFSKEGGR